MARMRCPPGCVAFIWTLRSPLTITENKNDSWLAGLHIALYESRMHGHGPSSTLNNVSHVDALCGHLHYRELEIPTISTAVLSAHADFQAKTRHCCLHDHVSCASPLRSSSRLTIIKHDPWDADSSIALP
jgi:hypothetical protein